MLTWNRYQANNDDDWPIRPDGLPSAPPVNCCLLLEDDPGDASSELLLESDITGHDCLQPESC